MNSTKTMVCHSDAISLRSGFGWRSVAAGGVAIFVLVKRCGVQNISALPMSTRELRRANPESYGTHDTRVRAFCGGVSLGARLHEPFGHENEVAGEFCLDFLGEGACAGFDVAEAPVERRQLLAQADDTQIHHAATDCTRMILGFVDQAPAEAARLPGRGHRPQ